MQRVAELILSAAAQPKPLGQVEWTTPGTYSWLVPAGLYFISPLVISGGWGSGMGTGTVAGNAGPGGNLRWARAIAVSPGETLTIVVGAGGPGKTVASGSQTSSAPTPSAIMRGATVLLQATGQLTGTTAISLPDVGGGTGGAGGAGSNTRGPGGGGAGGYSGNGSDGMAGSNSSSSLAATGGAGSGGASGTTLGGFGGGVGLNGEGPSGASSGGATAGNPGSGGVGSLYGGGAPGRSGNVAGIAGADGAVRIIFPAPARCYPSTRTGNE